MEAKPNKPSVSTLESLGIKQVVVPNHKVDSDNTCLGSGKSVKPNKLVSHAPQFGTAKVWVECPGDPKNITNCHATLQTEVKYTNKRVPFKKIIQYNTR